LCWLLASSLGIDLILLISDVRASPDTGVVGVGSASYLGRDSNLSSSAFEILSSVGGFRTCARTLSGLNGNKPLPLYAAIMFLLVSELTLAGLYR
jgi:hypothetical protein